MSYVNHFVFYRKLLAKVLLPKEAQQIDRAMEDFAKRYYECNPGLVDHPGNNDHLTCHMILTCGS